AADERRSRAPRAGAPRHARLAPRDVVAVGRRWLASLDAEVGQDGHQDIAKRGKLLPRVPDLADAKVAIGAEADVVVHPLRGKVTGLRQATDALVVLLGSQRRRGEADNDAHSRSSLPWV